MRRARTMAEPADVIARLLEVAGAAIVGVIASVATFRARFTAIERDQVAAGLARTAYEQHQAETRAEDHEYLERELERLRAHVATTVGRIELTLGREAEDRRRYRRDMTRRQLAILELVADVANKAGINNRVLDMIPRLLSEDLDDA